MKYSRFVLALLAPLFFCGLSSLERVLLHINRAGQFIYAQVYGIEFIKNLLKMTGW